MRVERQIGKARAAGNDTVADRLRSDFPGGRPRFFLFLAILLAFSWQSVLAETHNHFADDTLSAAATKHGARLNSGLGSPSDSPANCPICRELALAAHYLPPAPPAALPTPAAILVAPVVATESDLGVGRRSHFWRSRAPPSQLQA